MTSPWKDFPEGVEAVDLRDPKAVHEKIAEAVGETEEYPVCDHCGKQHPPEGSASYAKLATQIMDTIFRSNMPEPDTSALKVNVVLDALTAVSGFFLAAMIVGEEKLGNETVNPVTFAKKFYADMLVQTTRFLHPDHPNHPAKIFTEMKIDPEEEKPAS